MALVRADNRWNRQDLEKAKRQSEAEAQKQKGAADKFHEEARIDLLPSVFHHNRAIFRENRNRC
jgi:hypothetical protein